MEDEDAGGGNETRPTGRKVILIVSQRQERSAVEVHIKMP